MITVVGIFSKVFQLDLFDLLRSVREGNLSVEDAAKSLRLSALKEIEDACLDVSREVRKGVPEIIFAENKSMDDLVHIAQSFLEETGRVIITRVSEAQASAIIKNFEGKAEILHNAKGRAMVLRRRGSSGPEPRGKVALLTAGTVDIGVAEEAKTVLEEMGCAVMSTYDVGVAGIHRLFPAVKRVTKDDVDVVIVVAGMEGALPSIVNGLVAVPVIGVPSSSGYGAGGKGEGALVAMLQSCSPGLVVVNIDNGVGAAVAAALIAKRACKRRE